jgi:acetamidase/formamidase
MTWTGPSGVAEGTSYLPAAPGTVRWGLLPGAADPPTLTAPDGGVIVVDTVSQEGVMPDQGRDPVTFFGALGIGAANVLQDAIAIAESALVCDPPRTGPHLVTGPIAIDGIAPGDVLDVEILDLAPRCGYGLVSNRHGRGALPDLFPRPRNGRTPAVVTHLVTYEDGWLTLRGEGKCGGQDEGKGTKGNEWARLPFDPVLGIIGVAAEGPEPLHSVPPGAHGGNLDLAFLGPGWHLQLAARAPGGLLYVGDPHFAQGDGELALTAVEGSLRATLRVSRAARPSAARLACLRKAPVAESPGYLATIGLAGTLDEAVREASIAMISLLTEEYGMPAPVALSYLSAAARMNVTQVVNGGVRGVHLVVDKNHLIAGQSHLMGR